MGILAPSWLLLVELDPLRLGVIDKGLISVRDAANTRRNVRTIVMIPTGLYLSSAYQKNYRLSVVFPGHPKYDVLLLQKMVRSN